MDSMGSGVGMCLGRLFLGVLCCLVWTVGRAAETAVAVPERSTDPALEEPIRQLLIELRRRRLIPGEEGETRERLLQSLLSTFKTGGSIVQREGVEASRQSLIHRAETLRGRFLYVDIDLVGSGFAGELAAVRSRHVLPEKESGAILDLRAAEGNAVDEVPKTVRLVADWDCPLVALVDDGTRAAAEVFAQELRDGVNCVLIGRATRGLPYPLESVDLGDGVSVMLPDIPAGADPRPLVPDVPMSGVAGWSGEDDMASAGPRAQAVYRDDYVLKAVDLLTAIRAFGRKQF